MSDTSPLMLNMGAELSQASGVNPFAAQSAPDAGRGNEFAGVLQSVLQPEASANPATALLGREFKVDAGLFPALPDVNPLLLMQLANANNTPLLEEGLSLEELSLGNILPAGEQDFAWQGMLAAYDSQDPNTPYVIMAVGDDQGYQIEALTADELLHDPMQLANQTNIPMMPGQASPNLSLSLDSAASEFVEQDAVEPESPLALAAVQSMEGEEFNQPMVPNGQGEGRSKSTEVRLAHESRAGAELRANDLALNTDAQLDGNQQFQEAMEQARANKQDNLLNKSDAFTNILADQTQSRSMAHSGATTYATVSSMLAASNTTSTTAPTIAHMTIAPDNPAWGDMVGERVQWMASQNIQEAKIRLYPQDLGQLEVHIQLGKDQQTSISFSTPHAQVRDALETALPRLREMFGQNGLSLGDVNVSHHSSSEQGQARRDDTPSGSHATNRNKFMETGAIEASRLIPQQSRGNGMLDLYA